MNRFLSRMSAIALVVASLASTTPVHAATFTPGDLIKGPGDTVYYYGQNAKRYVFPTLKTYLTWYPDFTGVKTIPLSDLQTLPLGGNVTYRPGVKLVKITTDPKTYAVSANGTLRWIQTEQAAKDLYGIDWNKKVDDIPDAFFINYKVGAPIASAADFAVAAETQQAATINADKQLSVNGPPSVTITSDKQSVTSGGTAKLTVTAVFQGSGVFQSGVVKVNNQLVQTCSTLPCIVTSAPLASGSTNNFTAEVTDSNGNTGKSSAVTVTVSYGY